MKKLLKVLQPIFKINKLKNKLILSYTVILAISVFLISLSVYRKAYESLENEVKRHNSRELIQINNGINTLVNEMNRIALILNSDDEVLKIIEAKDTYNEIDQVRDYEKVQQLIRNASGFRSEIVGLTIFTADGRDFSMSSKSVKLEYDYQEEAWFEELKSKNSYFIGSHMQNRVIDSNAEPVISLAKVLKNTTSYETIGYILIDCSTRALENIFGGRKELENSSIFIVDTHSELIYSSKSEVYSFIEMQDLVETLKSHNQVGFKTCDIGNNKSLISYYTSSNTGWTVINAIPMQEIDKHFQDIRLSTIIAIIASAVLTFVISYIIALSITKPIKKLKEKMEIIENGNFDVRVDINTNDEIGQLGESFDNMALKLNDMVKQVYQSELIKREAEISALQSQINPHFLYNTLATIESLALMKGNMDVGEMSRALSKIFRYNIEPGELTTIGREMEQIKLYFAIQKYRYRERLDYTIFVEETLMDCRIIKLLIQPIVENAVVHGVENKRSTVNISISAKETKKGEIAIVISDTGGGISEGSLEKIKEEIRDAKSLYWQKDKKGRYHVGLKNVNYRIKLKYGEAYGLWLTSKFGDGTTIEILIPKVC